MRAKSSPRNLPLHYTNTHPRKPYRPCQLVDHNGEMGKYWVLVYWVWDDTKRKLVRKRHTGGLNRIPDIVARRQQAAQLIERLDKELYQGQHTITYAKPPVDPAVHLGRRILIEVADDWLEDKRHQLREKSFWHYRNFVKNLSHYLRSHGLSRLLVRDLNSATAFGFLQWTLETLNYSNRSYNNQLTIFRTLISWIIKHNRLIFMRHPLEVARKLPATQQKHRAYSMEQMKAIKEECLRQEDEQLLLFIEFIFFTLIRPGNELRMVKIKHIQGDRLFISGEVSKNRRDAYVTLPLVFRQKLKSMNLDQYDPEFYLFTTDQKPGPSPVGINYFPKHFRKIARELNLQKGFDIYSFKHSGAVHMYLAEIPLDKIKEQCRHTSIDQTLTYLRDLDVFRDSSAYDAVKGF